MQLVYPVLILREHGEFQLAEIHHVPANVCPKRDSIWAYLPESLKLYPIKWYSFFTLTKAGNRNINSTSAYRSSIQRETDWTIQLQGTALGYSKSQCRSILQRLNWQYRNLPTPVFACPHKMYNSFEWNYIMGIILNIPSYSVYYVPLLYKIRFISRWSPERPPGGC